MKARCYDEVTPRAPREKEMPDGVKQVYLVMVESAEMSGRSKDHVYASFHRHVIEANKRVPGGEVHEWRICSNFEDLPWGLVYAMKDGLWSWFRRERRDGSDVELESMDAAMDLAMTAWLEVMA